MALHFCMNHKCFSFKGGLSGLLFVNSWPDADVSSASGASRASIGRASIGPSTGRPSMGRMSIEPSIGHVSIEDSQALNLINFLSDFLRQKCHSIFRKTD